MNIENSSFKVGTGWNNTCIRKEGWTEGEVITPFGFVDVYAQGDKTSFHMTQLRFIHKGRIHTRIFRKKRYTLRGIATKAKQFAKEISNV